MPLYYKQHARGYDLERELEFIEIDGVRYQLGSAGSLMLVCPTCGQTRFRDRHDPGETCWSGHGAMVLLPLRGELYDKLDALWTAEGRPAIPVEERRAERLKSEAKKPWHWIFGDKTEADFPNGYVKES